MSKIEISPEIGARFKHFRESVLNLSQDEMAEQLGATQRTISFIETGKQSITTKILTKATSKYRLNSEWLTRGVGQPISDKKPDIDAIDNMQVRITVMENQIAKLSGMVETMLKLLQKA